jgi:hypothetical protein
VEKLGASYPRLESRLWHFDYIRACPQLTSVPLFRIHVQSCLTRSHSILLIVIHLRSNPKRYSRASPFNIPNHRLQPKAYTKIIRIIHILKFTNRVVVRIESLCVFARKA